MSAKIVWGIVGFLLLVGVVGGVGGFVYWKAEPGAEVDYFVFIVTKPGKTFLTNDEIGQELSKRLAGTHNLVLTYPEPCGEMTLADTTGKFARFEIRNATTLYKITQQGAGRWVIETSAPKKHSVALATRVEPSYAVDNPVYGSALDLFNRLKSACSSE